MRTFVLAGFGAAFIFVTVLILAAFNIGQQSMQPRNVVHMGAAR